MTPADSLRAQLRLPAACAPMFLVSNPDLVREACRAGLIGGLPRQNARTIEEFDGWLASIRRDLDTHAQDKPDARIGPIAVNLSQRLGDSLEANLEVCDRHRVGIIISAVGDPTELIKRVHAHGAQVFHDVTSLRFAEKAIQAGADGLTCVAAGGGGHSGTVSPLVLVPRIREMFSGTVLAAGAFSTGAAIRAAEILGADLAYMGTRFIATRESGAPAEHKRMILENDLTELRYTAAVSGVPANWLAPSMRGLGLDPDGPPAPQDGMAAARVPSHVKPWKNVWSAGQGIDLIRDLPSVEELVMRLRSQYVTACTAPDMALAARIADQAAETAARL